MRKSPVRQPMSSMEAPATAAGQTANLIGHPHTRNWRSRLPPPRRRVPRCSGCIGVEEPAASITGKQGVGLGLVAEERRTARRRGARKAASGTSPLRRSAPDRPGRWDREGGWQPLSMRGAMRCNAAWPSGQSLVPERPALALATPDGSRARRSALNPPAGLTAPPGLLVVPPELSMIRRTAADRHISDSASSTTAVSSMALRHDGIDPRTDCG